MRTAAAKAGRNAKLTRNAGGIATAANQSQLVSQRAAASSVTASVVNMAVPLAAVASPQNTKSAVVTGIARDRPLKPEARPLPAAARYGAQNHLQRDED